MEDDDEQRDERKFYAMQEGGLTPTSIVTTKLKSEDNDDSSKQSISVHDGYSSIDDKDLKKLQENTIFNPRKKYAITVMQMTIFAVLGTILRIIMAQLFGEECKNPGTVGWLKGEEPLCVTADGETSIEGGIIFADLPANLLGSFIMGLMQTTDTMNFPKSFPIAWLSENHPFQSENSIHLAVRTGFCGSLTTFSSWNSEMIVMMLGEMSNSKSLFFRGLLGYLIGVETSLASFILGKNIAMYIHSHVNPALATETEETKKKQEHGVYINKQLPDFERRFLSGFDMKEHNQHINLRSSKHLEKWRLSTQKNRMVVDDLLPLLIEIEYQALVSGQKLDKDILNHAIEAGWDVKALYEWVVLRSALDLGESLKPSPSLWLVSTTLTFFAMTILLIFGLIYLNSEDSYTITYRTMIYAACFAPSGALLRWKLSSLNGGLPNYPWFPFGTFLANFIGSIVSVTMIGLEFRFNGTNDFWVIGSIRAIKIGFAGCLSTVSTFIAEVATFLKSPHPLKAYVYIFVSLICCGSIGAVCYKVASS